jgi:hypothetical protein
VVEFLYQFKDTVEVIKIDRADYTYQYGQERKDQTWVNITESAIEFIVRRRTEEEIARKGRYP